MRDLLLEIEEQIKVTEDVTELKRLQSQRDKLAVAVGHEEKLTLELEELKGKHNSLKDDYIKAVRFSVVDQNEPPKGDEPKTDEEIYNAWKSGVLK